MLGKAICSLLLTQFALCFGAAAPEAVDLCDLISNPGDFNGKRISVQATYRYGFEWQELYRFGCWKKGRVWLAVSPDMPKSVQRKLNRLPRHQGTVNAIFTGVFHDVGISLAGSSYSCQLALEDFEHVSIVSKSGAVPMALSEAERGRLHEEDSPKGKARPTR
ncbi:MAG: hypothetical protein LLG20_09020 [Acidobacteriales bacterium]|nr:hypothetical protein [Terriglobales bacterium]